MLKSVKNVYQLMITQMQETQISFQEFHTTNPKKVVEQLLSVDSKSKFDAEESAHLLTKKEEKKSYKEEVMEKLGFPALPKRPISEEKRLNLQRKLVLDLEIMPC